MTEKAILGNDPALLEVVNAAKIVAATDVSTLINGESGTGKELLARLIHQGSPRHGRPFISVNCAALPENLAESLLFGHIKGSFTGATSDREGYIRAAGGGTLFLDEVAELPAAVQAKLLRFLEQGEIFPVGSSTPLHVNVRIVAATHRDLQREVIEGRFREDLFYRLNVVPLHMPTLRQRASDIPYLLAHFSQEFAAGHGTQAITFEKSARQALQQYRWPGNIRELRNLCERLSVLLPGRAITADNLPAEFRQNSQPASSLFRLPPEGLVLSDLEKSLIQQALEQANGNQSRAARLLGISRDTLLYRLKKFALI